MATQDKLTSVRFLTQLDPYYYEVDNRPTGDLDANVKSVALAVDAAKSGVSVDGIALGILTSGLIGNTPTLVSDIGYPGGLTFSLSQGFFASKENISGTDTRQISKLALLVDQYTGSCPAPAGAGNSIVYTVQCRYADVTTGTDTLPTYDPNNEHATGMLMIGVLEVSIKAGVEATTGAQVAPTPDAGWDEVFQVTVSDTTTDIAAGNIAETSVLALGAAGGGGAGGVSATTSVEGIAELATAAEVQALTDATRIVTPSTLGSLVASETQAGILELATTAQATALSNDTTAITPLKLLNVFDSQVAAVGTNGTIQLASNAVTQTGTDAVKAVTPASLAFTLSAYDFAGAISSATTSATGVVELATNAESLTGTDTARAVTPASLKHTLDNTSLSVADASTSAKGIVELATDAEALAGTDALRAITPASLAYWYTNHVSNATSSAAGLVELATNTEVAAGADTSRAVTPAGAASVYMPKSGGAFTGNISAVDITASGDVSGANLVSTSARDQKSNIQFLEDALELCAQLRGVTYNWKGTGAPDIGLIADEVLEVIPEIVRTEDGVAKQMDYTHLAGVFVNAINALSEELTQERKRNDALEERLLRVEELLGE